MEHPPRRADRELPAETARVFAIFGPGSRTGYWEPPERLEAVAAFGQVRLDFADANLYEGVTEIYCLALFGNVEILVPAEVEIDAQGAGIFGGFEQREPKRKWVERLERGARDGDGLVPDENVEPPLLRIRGAALFGSVVVRVG